jgi:CBS domain-containing protein
MTPSTPSAPAPALVQRYGGRSFDEATVEDVMMNGIVTCRAETSLGDVARMMVGYGIHCLVVTHPASNSGSERWSVISDLDLVAAAGTDKTAGEAAHTDVVSVPSGAPLEHAAKRMVKHTVHHLVVVDPDTAHPVGIVSTTGIARALAVTRWEKEARR